MRTIRIGETKILSNEISAAIDVLKSGSLRQGKVCKAFEDEFAGKVGADYAISSSK